MAGLFIVATSLARAPSAWADASANASADSAAPVRAVQSAMQRYFAGEKTGGLVFIGLGLASLTFGGLAMWRGSRGLRAAAGVALGFGALQLAVGAVVTFRTDAQLARLLAGVQADGAKVGLAEMMRLEGVRRTFVILKWVEIALIAGGAATFAVGMRKDSPIAIGLGAALAAYGALTLAQDLFADGRAAEYLRALGMFRLHAAPLLDPAGGALAGGFVGAGGVF